MWIAKLGVVDSGCVWGGRLGCGQRRRGLTRWRPRPPCKALASCPTRRRDVVSRLGRDGHLDAHQPGCTQGQPSRSVDGCSYFTLSSLGQGWAPRLLACAVRLTGGGQPHGWRLSAFALVGAWSGRRLVIVGTMHACGSWHDAQAWSGRSLHDIAPRLHSTTRCLAMVWPAARE